MASASETLSLSLFVSLTPQTSQDEFDHRMNLMIQLGIDHVDLKECTVSAVFYLLRVELDGRLFVSPKNARILRLEAGKSHMHAHE